MTLLPVPRARAQAVQLQVDLVMTLCKAVIKSSALLPVVKKVMNRWQRASAFLLNKERDTNPECS